MFLAIILGTFGTAILADQHNRKPTERMRTFGSHPC